MTLFSWQELMTQWNNDLLSTDLLMTRVPAEVRSSGWLGYPGATEEQLVTAEARLGVQLPPSYRTFLQFTNGWRVLTGTIDQLWSTQTVEWFAVRGQDIIDEWIQAGEDQAARYGRQHPQIPDEEYFVYGEGQNFIAMRDEYLQTALEISDYGDAAIYLLNPQIVTPEGEWEAWLFASWLCGAKRYRSFWDLMQAEYAGFLKSRAQYP